MDMKSSDFNVAKRQKINDTKQKQGVSSQTSCIELVLFNSDSLFKIASYLPATDLLNLALTCRRYGMSESNNSLSLIEETARRVVQDITTEERPRNDGESWLANYYYLRSALSFDQLLGFVYVDNTDKSCIRSSSYSYLNVWSTAISNLIMKAGKHFVSFTSSKSFIAGVMRPGELDSGAYDINPNQSRFFNQHYSQSKESLIHNTNNSIHSCTYYSYNDTSFSSNWIEDEDAVGNGTRETWSESFSSDMGCELGLLLDLDEGTLTVYKNGQRLGVVCRGLTGHYCWVLSTTASETLTSQVTIKREKVPESLG